MQRQLALVDNVAVQRGTHRLAFGVDFRRLSPQLDQAQYFLLPFFSGIPTAEAGNPDGGTFVYSSVGANLLFRNLSLFAQDTWQAAPRLTLTYGLRWDVDFAPAALSGPGLPAVVNYNNLSQLALAPPGTPPFSTRYGNVAPRIGVAYQLSQKNGTPVTVLRAGFGVYHDLATSEVGNNLNQGYPYSAYNFIFGGTFPASPAPPQIEAPNAANGGRSLVSTRIFGCLTRLSGTWRFSRIWETSRPCQFLTLARPETVCCSRRTWSPRTRISRRQF